MSRSTTGSSNSNQHIHSQSIHSPSSANTAYHAMFTGSTPSSAAQRKARQSHNGVPFSSSSARGLMPPNSSGTRTNRTSISPTKVRSSVTVHPTASPPPQPTNAQTHGQSQTNQNIVTSSASISNPTRNKSKDRDNASAPMSTVSLGPSQPAKVEVATANIRVSAADFLANAMAQQQAMIAAAAGSSQQQSHISSSASSSGLSSAMRTPSTGTTARRSLSSGATRITPSGLTTTPSTAIASQRSRSTTPNGTINRVPTAAAASGRAVTPNSNSGAVSTPSKRQQYARALTADQQFITDSSGNRIVIKGTPAYYRQQQRAAEGVTSLLYETDDVDYGDVYARSLSHDPMDHHHKAIVNKTANSMTLDAQTNGPSSGALSDSQTQNSTANVKKYTENSLYRSRTPSIDTKPSDEAIVGLGKMSSPLTLIASPAAASGSNNSAGAALAAAAAATVSSPRASVRTLLLPVQRPRPVTASTPLSTINNEDNIENLVKVEQHVKSSSPVTTASATSAFSPSRPIMISESSEKRWKGINEVDSEESIKLMIESKDDLEEFLGDQSTAMKQLQFDTSQLSAHNTSAMLDHSTCSAMQLNTDMSVEEWIGELEDLPSSSSAIDGKLRNTGNVVAGLYNTKDENTIVSPNIENRVLQKMSSYDRLFAELTPSPASTSATGSVSAITVTKTSLLPSSPSRSGFPPMPPSPAIALPISLSMNMERDLDQQKDTLALLLHEETLQECKRDRTIVTEPAEVDQQTGSEILPSPISSPSPSYSPIQPETKKTLSTSISSPMPLSSFIPSTMTLSSNLDDSFELDTALLDHLSHEDLKCRLRMALSENRDLQDEVNVLMLTKKKMFEESQSTKVIDYEQQIAKLAEENKRLHDAKIKGEETIKALHEKNRDLLSQNMNLSHLLMNQSAELNSAKQTVQDLHQLYLQSMDDKRELDDIKQYLLEKERKKVNEEIQVDIVDIDALLQQVEILNETKIKYEQHTQSLNEKNMDLLNQNMKMTELLMNKPLAIKVDESVQAHIDSDGDHDNDTNSNTTFDDDDLPSPPSITKAEIYAHEYLKKADRLQNAEKEVKAIEQGLLNHFRKLTEEAVDCLVELESDKLMIEETFANINFSQLGGSHDDGIRYRPSDINYLYGSPSNRYPITSPPGSSKSSPVQRRKPPTVGNSPRPPIASTTNISSTMRLSKTSLSDSQEGSPIRSVKFQPGVVMEGDESEE